MGGKPYDKPIGNIKYSQKNGVPLKMFEIGSLKMKIQLMAIFLGKNKINKIIK